MIKLPSDFTLSRYGLDVRLVDESDAEFIVKLRTDPKLSKFIHSTDSSIEKQKEWIRGYKEREVKGLEYYFIFFTNAQRVGLHRIYSIKENGTFTTGSWLFSPDAPMEASIAAVLITDEIAFDTLHFKLNDLYDGVHESNTNVLKFNKMLGVDFTHTIDDVKGKYYVGALTSESFHSKAEKIKKLLNIK